MPISWNEIRARALAFSKEWEGETSEKAEAKTFWDSFFNVFGVSRRRVASFEEPAKKTDGQGGYIDLLWKGILLVEHKSKGKNLDRAFKQAIDYFPGIKDRDLPKYVLVSDFARFRLFDLDDQKEVEFELQDLHTHIREFGFIAGYKTATFDDQDPVNIKAAERMGDLHDRLKSIRYTGHKLEVFLVRLLFCLFADDTGIFPRRLFQDLIEQRTAEDGHDLAQWLGNLYEVLDTPHEHRLTTLDEQLAEFPYVNGSLFSERLPTAAFDKEMRETLLECCAVDWSEISPAIFGALFQAVMDPVRRRNLGAHYTSEANILKLIRPLFLDRLREKYESTKHNVQKLKELQVELSRLKFLDPACGCGNFLVVTYREIRLLELEILRVIYKNRETPSLNVADYDIFCDVDQFYGIEIEEFPAQIAQTAMWMMDHQMNLKVSEEFGSYFVRLPLKKSASIVNSNALSFEWSDVVAPKDLDYIIGNPPFAGKKEQSSSQKKDFRAVFAGVQGAQVLDYVAAWYRKAALYMAVNTKVHSAFVSTNSIVQGEQVAPLWSDLLSMGASIEFAHQTFEWTSQAKGAAAVHCIIIGFSLSPASEKTIYEYENPASSPLVKNVARINPYLLDAPTVLLSKRKTSISQAPPICYGSFALDDGHYTLSRSEKEIIIEDCPRAINLMKPFLGSTEFINNIERWCLWLKDAAPQEIRECGEITKRIAAVRTWRQSRDREATRRLAQKPTSFAEIRQPQERYLAVPTASSQRRLWLPIGFLEPSVIASNQLYIVSKATLYEFAVLSSAMHMAWMRAVCGRIKSDYRYSASIVYNNFPWPVEPSAGKMSVVKKAAQDILDIRASLPSSSLADLYDPLLMPAKLVGAHQRLDSVVDSLYARKKFSGDSDRAAYLFAQYAILDTPLVKSKPAIRRQKT